MAIVELARLSDGEVEKGLKVAAARDAAASAEFLRFLAEFDARRLFVPQGFASMHEYCVEVVHLSGDSASKRLHAARVAWRFPQLFAALADGRLHLSAIGMLATHLTADNVDVLIAAATHRSRARIAVMLAERFPQPEVMALVCEVALVSGVETHADGSAPGQIGCAPTPAPAPVSGQVTPRSPGRSEVRFMFSQADLDKLRLAESLLGRKVEPGDLAGVFAHALDALIEQHEKRTLRASARSRHGADTSRHVPAAVRREVCEPDGRQCTFVGDTGRRCTAHRRLDFDHIVPLARGGRTTADNLRLLCPVHNQHAADRVFGAGFMAEKRAESRARLQVAAAARSGSAPGHVNEPSSDRSHVDELIPWLMSLKFRKDEAKRGAELCLDMRDASLEERIRVALKGLGRARFERNTTRTPVASP